MKHRKHHSRRKSGRIVIAVSALLMTLCLSAGSMLESNVDQVNNFLDTKTTAIHGGGTYDKFTPDGTYLTEKGKANTDALKKAHEDMGVAISEEGSVLLKNDGALPMNLATEKKVTVMGLRASDKYAIYGMDIGSPEESSQNVNISDALNGVGFEVNSTVYEAYNALSETPEYKPASATAARASVNMLPGTGYFVTELTDAHKYTVAEPSVDAVKAQAGENFDASVAEYDDAAIVVLGRPASEQSDYYAGEVGADPAGFTQSKTKNVLSLSDGERALLEYAKSNFEKVVVLLGTNNAMEVEELEQDAGINAVLWIGGVGNTGFKGVANVLAGKANPSGRLVDIYASSTTSAPATVNMGLYHYANYGTSGQNAYIEGPSGKLESNKYYADAYVMYAESIYTGYKYYETRYEDSILNDVSSNATSNTGASPYASGDAWSYADEVTYAFGHGLSYTRFEQKITDVQFSSDHRSATLTVSVKNTGSMDGKSVVQVYGQSHYTEYDKTNGVEKAAVQLLAFEKVAVASGKTETVEVEVDMQLLASYDETNAKTYIMEASDEYYFALGHNSNTGSEGSHAAINNILALKGKTTADGMDENGDTDGAYRFSWSKENERLFSTSKSGATITNQLDDVDFNYFSDGVVSYLSRKDWKGTWPKEYKSGIGASEKMMTEYLKNDCYTPEDEDISSLIFGKEYAENEDVDFTDMFGKAFEDADWDKLMDKITIADMVRYTCCGNRNFSSMPSVGFIGDGVSYTENGSVGIAKTLKQQSDELAPWYVAEDDPNANYGTNSFATAPVMASTWNKDLMYEMGVLWGNDALFINIPMVWAPSINTHRTAYNGRNGEYYSEDGVLSGFIALAVGDGALSKGLITSIKHFAFNSQEVARNGISTFMTEQTAREGELRGFQVALEGTYDEEGNRTSVLGIMTAYNRIGAKYVGAHKGLMNGILREEWDYNGYATSDLVVTASIYMTYAESMLVSTTNFDSNINKSTDMTAWGITVAELVDKVDGDAELLARIKENTRYSLYTFAQSNLANWMSADTEVVWIWNWWRIAYIGGAALCGLLLLFGMYLYIRGVFFHRVNEKAPKETVVKTKKNVKKAK